MFALIVSSIFLAVALFLSASFLNRLCVAYLSIFKSGVAKNTKQTDIHLIFTVLAWAGFYFFSHL